MSTQMEERLAAALHDLTGDHPYVPDFDVIARRARRSARREVLVRGGASVSALAVAAAAIGLATAGGGSAGPVPPVPADRLDQLAVTLAADPAPAGDATEVVRTTSYPGQSPTRGADLYADDGRYFYSQDPAGLAAEVRSDDNVANGVFGREVSIAKRAAAGSDADTAARQMAAAALDPGTASTFVPSPPSVPLPPGLSGAQAKAYLLAHAPSGPVVVDDNDIWVNALDALVAGAGQPQVRAGVLRILSTLPGITVTDTTTDGIPTVTISATGTPDTAGGYRETLVIGAANALPLAFTGGNVGAAPSVTVTYHVSRVTLADLH